MPTVRRRVPTPLVLLGLALSGCSSPAEPALESACLPAVRVGDVVYQLAPDETLSPTVSPTGVVAVVQRLNPDCPDTPGVDGGVLVSDGDSNFFPIGTLLRSIPGVPTTERIAVEWLGEWLVLVPDGAGSGGAA